MKISEMVQFLLANHNIILHGAPGTGKTYLAKDIASQMIFGKNRALLLDDEKKIFNEHVEFVQFHQSYDYTDFVEGLRPYRDDDNKVGFELLDGIFKAFCEIAVNSKSSKDFFPNFDEVYNEFLEDLAEESLTLETETRHKKFVVERNSVNMYAIPQAGAKTLLPITREMIRAYLERGEIIDWKPYTPVIAKYIAKHYKSKLKKSTTSASDKAYIFVIDEINRGEMSKIFGELFFSIDPGYRGKDGKIRTQYANMQKGQNGFDRVLGITDSSKYGHFFVPENVYIIGTMNDIDRSVESMDFAMRRRFAFKEISAEDSMSMLDNPESWKNAKGESVDVRSELAHIKNRMLNLNDEILKEEFNLGSSYQIGAAYFLKFAKFFDGANATSAFNNLWDYHLEGVLREYLRGMSDVDGLLEKLKTAYDVQDYVLKEKKSESTEG